MRSKTISAFTNHDEPENNSPMMRVIYKTSNGWLIACETGSISVYDIASCHTFETMLSLTQYLLKLADESQEKAKARDAKGHFRSTKKKTLCQTKT